MGASAGDRASAEDERGATLSSLPFLCLELITTIVRIHVYSCVYIRMNERKPGVVTF